MMDYIIDLEEEKIDAILAKSDSDPESEEIKHTERLLWEKIKKKTLQGRRTGVGITAEGDMIAGLGLTYGTDEATAFLIEVYKNIIMACYDSYVYLLNDVGELDDYYVIDDS